MEPWVWPVLLLVLGAGLAVLEKARVRSALIQAVEKAARRAKELGRKR